MAKGADSAASRERLVYQQPRTLRKVEGQCDRELTDRELTPVNIAELEHAAWRPTEGPTSADLTSPFGGFAPFGYSCVCGHRERFLPFVVGSFLAEGCLSVGK